MQLYLEVLVAWQAPIAERGQPGGGGSTRLSGFWRGEKVSAWGLGVEVGLGKGHGR